ncbi:FAD-binding domain-containing protein [Corynespora cassiicola Philippines]|uniref:FAD-binding domain-containing protein n=1 Tax=Corynespora cassiicola Philippines TaxID=1448308 RepID=A0A2T2P262_CORCC|nr:FAD-binding domain-containing protein [Corynespora cassiicola Philippines]
MSEATAALVDCAALSALHPGSVFFKNTLQYTAATTSYFAAFERELQPACVVEPDSAEELGRVVKCLASKLGQASVAVKGGGHTAWAGAANIDNGVLISLANFKTTAVDSSSGTISIGAGERWGDVYSALESHGLAVVGGRVSKVGVSGLVLGGGLSFFSEQRGFVADAVTNFEVVLSSGAVVNANARENADLFKALKGGNNNFGIVTKFDLPTFQQGNMWGGTVFYPASAFQEIATNFYEWTDSPDRFGALIIARVYSAQVEGVSVNPYSTDAKQVSPVLKRYADIQPQYVSTIREDTLLGMANEQASFSTDGARQWYFTTSFRNDQDMILEAEKLFATAIEPLKAIPGFVLSLTLQPLTRQMLTESQRQEGSNSLGLEPEDGPLVIVLLASVHQNAEDDDKVVAAVQELQKKIEAVSAERGLAARYRFMNYAYKDSPVLEGYGRDAVAQLKAASKKYDPEQFFQKQVTGGFKISRVR